MSSVSNKMKTVSCPYCGSAVDINEDTCKYCGMQVKAFEKHRADMNRYKEEFEATKEAVIEENVKTASRAACITVIFALLALILIFVVCAANGSEIGYKLRVNQNAKVFPKYAVELDKYEEQKDYIGYTCFCSEKELTYFGYDKEYVHMQSVCHSYSQMCKYIQQDLHNANYETILSRDRDDDITYVVRQYESIMDEVERWGDALENHPGAADVVFLSDCLISHYYHIPYEEMDDFKELSTIQKNVKLLEGIGNGDKAAEEE